MVAPDGPQAHDGADGTRRSNDYQTQSPPWLRVSKGRRTHQGTKAAERSKENSRNPMKPDRAGSAGRSGNVPPPRAAGEIGQAPDGRKTRKSETRTAPSFRKASRMDCHPTGSRRPEEMAKSGQTSTFTKGQWGNSAGRPARRATGGGRTRRQLIEWAGNPGFELNTQ